MVSELCAETSLSPREIARPRRPRTADSISAAPGTTTRALEELLSGGELEEELLEKIALREAVDTLPERERMVIDLRYYHGLTQDKTARILGVSRCRSGASRRRRRCSPCAYFSAG